MHSIKGVHMKSLTAVLFLATLCSCASKPKDDRVVLNEGKINETTHFRKDAAHWRVTGRHNTTSEVRSFFVNNHVPTRVASDFVCLPQMEYLPTGDDDFEGKEESVRFKRMKCVNDENAAIEIESKCDIVTAENTVIKEAKGARGGLWLECY